MKRRRMLTLSSALLAGSFAGCQDALQNGTGTETDDPGGGGSGGTPTGTATQTATPTGTEAQGPAADEIPSMEATMPAVDPDVTDATLSTLVGSTNAFAIDLYKQLGAEEAGENLFASPISVSVALAMTYAGARGETRTQMRDTLRYSLDDESLHPAFNELQSEIISRGETADSVGTESESGDGVPFQLRLVNAVWGQEDYPFRDPYLQTLEDHYAGGFNPVDFAMEYEAVRETINAWVADQTEDKIEDLLPEGSLDDLTRLVLTNAIYFMANWEHTFPKDATSQEQFTALDGSTSDVPMMSMTEHLPHAEVDGAQALELPYVGGDVSMLLILPPEGQFESYEADFDRATLASLVDGLQEGKGNVAVPKFEFESSVTLSDALKTLGMPVAFTEGQADFSGLADLQESGENLYIDEAFHDTYVAVDEEGTEAAAATAVVIGAESAPVYDFVADRPFMFAIRDRPTGALLFLGRVTDAGAAQPSG